MLVKTCIALAKAVKNATVLVLTLVLSTKSTRYTEENKCRFSSTHQRPYMHIGKSARERKQYNKNVINGFLY